MQRSNIIQTINQLLSKLEQEKSLDAGLDLAKAIISIALPKSTLPDNESIKEDVFDVTALGNSKIEPWFKDHPFLGGSRVALTLFSTKDSKVESKFYQLNQKINKQVIAGAVHITPNWEDSPLHKYEEYKIGVDFFLTPNSNSLLMALSKEGNLRVIEFGEKLSNTQIDILEKIIGAGEQPTHEAIHNSLWESFAIQEVNKQFYQGISEHFSELLQSLITTNNKHQEDAKLFASRLLGRLLFVWFLRKKGLISESGGYFDTNETTSTEYYHKTLKQLFFHTLNTAKEDRTLFVDDLTPYLNGGLFEPHENDWYNETIIFPDGFFKRLYNHFEQFNFTTDESSPEYEQIAIDPEMLGRVFESLLATQIADENTRENARKAKGTFYTPREIVSYICKETLRVYLYNGLKDETLNPGVDKLLDSSDADVALSHSNFKRDLWGEHRSKLIIPQVIALLDELTVLDPACGSGAFPMGMVQLLVRTYERLEGRFDSYKTKLKIIQDSIYGVDIEPMAVEIARLRTWLSLVVDEKDTKNVEPLPNLDFKYVCANTLIKLEQSSGDLFNDSELDQKLAEVRRLYFNARKHHRKLELQEKYSKLANQQTGFFEDTRTKQLKSFDPFKNSKPAEFFEPEYMLGVDKFSVVIGNPPYIHLEKMALEQRELYKKLKYKTYEARGDIYSLFYERGFELLQESGVLGYITSNKWMRAGYGKSLREFFTSETNPLQLIDLGGGIFESATVDTNILIAVKSTYENETQAVTATKEFDITNMSDFIRQESVDIKFSDGDSWTILSPIEQSIKAKIEKYGTPLKDWDIQINYGIKTGLNEAFIIDGKKREELIAADPKSAEIIRPILRGRDISQGSFKFADLYVILAYFGSHKIIPTHYPEIYKHLKQFEDRLKQRGQSRYNSTGKPNTKGDYPGQHHWLELDNNPRQEYMDDFDKQKILYREISERMDAVIDNDGYFVNNKCYLVTGEYLKFLCGFLNSALFDIVLKQVNTTGGKGPEFMKTVFVHKPSGSDYTPTLDDLFKIYDLSQEEINFISSSVSSND